MHAIIVGKVIDVMLGLAGGIYMTLLGFRVIGKKEGVDSNYDKQMRKLYPILKVCGPGLLVFGTVLLAVRLGQTESTPVDWKRYSTEDGVCSADFPGVPEKRSPTDVKPGGLTLSRGDGGVALLLTFSDIAEEAKAKTLEELAQVTKQNLVEFGSKQGIIYKFLSEQKVSANGVPGIELEFSVGQKLVLRTKIFIYGTRCYRITATATPTTDGESEAKQFFDSFRFERVTQ